MSDSRDDLARDGLRVVALAARSVNRRGTSVDTSDLESAGHEELAVSLELYTPDCGPWRVFPFPRLTRAMARVVDAEYRRTRASPLVGEGGRRLTPAEETLGTRDIARLARVSECTARRWIDRGLLPGFRMPGSGWRRVRLSAFEAFCRGHQIPLGRSDGDS